MIGGRIPGSTSLGWIPLAFQANRDLVPLGELCYNHRIKAESMSSWIKWSACLRSIRRPIIHLFLQRMTRRDIIDAQLELFFGRKFPQKIQALIDDELTQGRWVDGYHLAVCRDVIDGDDARTLLEIVIRQHPELRIDREALLSLIEDKLPQSMGASVSWIVDDSGAYALTDSLRVARFDGVRLIWRTPRLSLDGIVFDSLTDGRLRGRGWHGSHESLDAPFEVDFETGNLLKGQIVPGF